MDNRIQLNSLLKTLVGTPNVYFQPPASISLSYPCVIYNIGNGDAKFANNKLYKYDHKYELIFIYKKPNNEIIEKVLNELPMCKLDRTYVVDNLNHYAFSVYY